MEERIYKPKAYSENLLNNKSGVYQIRNIANGKLYIGSSLNLKKRGRAHFVDLKANRHVNTHLQNSFNKYGINNFIFEIIEFTNPDETLNIEQYWIDKLEVISKGYNINPNAILPPDSKGENNPMYGKFHSEESKLKMSKNKRGKKTYGDNPRAIPIICLETLEVYDSYKRACDILHKDLSSITKNCDGLYKNPALNFMRLSDYLKVCLLDN